MANRAKLRAQEYVPAVPVEELAEHPRNPNRGDEARLSESIEVSGFYGAVIVQRSTGYVLAGNHRLRAARAKGITALPVIYLDVSNGEAERIMLADNRTTRLGSDDPAGLKGLLVGLLEDFGSLEGTGYTPADLATLDGLLDPTDESKKVGPQTGDIHLKWGDKAVPMTAEEAERLTEAFDLYANKAGVSWGFVTALLEGSPLAETGFET